MNNNKLKQYIISSSTRLYAVLDGAQVPDLPMQLYKSELPHYCLLPGELEPELLYAAPHLVFLPSDHEFTEKVLDEGFGNYWGIFAQSRASMIEMRKHFRALMSVVTEDGQPLQFRYYDPRVLRRFLPTCTSDELKTFFGKADAFFAETEDGQGLLSFQMENDELKQIELN